MSVRDMSGPMLAYCIVVTVFLGAAMGSFLHCAAWRISRGESFVKGRSRCPACGHELSLPDLIPLLSWLFLRGKCRRCGAKIPVRYFLAELFFAAITVACLCCFGLTWLCLRNWGFLCCLFLLSLVDAEIKEIPDGCLIAAVLIWVLTLPFLWSGLRDLLLHVGAGIAYGAGVLLLSLAMDRLLKKESLGGGDVKLLAVIGLYLGFVQTLFCLLLSCVIGLAQALLREKGKEKQFPFGPALSAAAALMLFFGQRFAVWYLSFL